MTQGVLSGMDVIWRFWVMQLDGSLLKVNRFVGFNIVYVMFLIVCNRIIN